ncbi:hypothetical protein ACHQM5_018199 [Ranunculus cassubicifolius]
MWAATLGVRILPIKRKVHPQNLLIQPSDFPGLDVFICTADPHKEPPSGVVNTALSVMAYDYPTEKISIYISDDGGSKLTLFAFMEAAKFATHWLPFCRENNLLHRSPDAYFASHEFDTSYPNARDIKMMYESMKLKVESVVEKGVVDEESESLCFNKWTTGCTSKDHPSIIQVLLESGKDMDISGHEMPNLVYVSREKKKDVQHRYKAGALNALIRVSAAMTNAPIILTLDCDMYSNDPTTPIQALCFLLDPSEDPPRLGFVQFPQRFHGVSKNDIYASEHKRLFRINKPGMDGHRGPHYAGTGCFFRRRAFFGGPFSQNLDKIPELNPCHVVTQPIKSELVQHMAHHVSSCTYEEGTSWGAEMGVKYGTIVEDVNTGYRLLCEGWKSVFYDSDERPAFLGDVPITLHDSLSQQRRWAAGLLQIGLSKYSPVTFGTKSLGLPMGLCFCHLAFWAIWSFPITIYAFLPPLALLNGVHIFPQVSSGWFYLYTFMVLGAYGQDCLEFIHYGSTFRQWYNDQRVWMIKGLSSFLFALIDHFLKLVGVPAFAFNLTSKVVDDEQNKRYEQGLLEFGVASPLFLPMTTAAVLHLLALIVGIFEIFRNGNLNEVFLQLSISGFVVMNCWPIYEAITLRTDRGKMPAITTLTSMILAWIMYFVSLFILKT